MSPEEKLAKFSRRQKIRIRSYFQMALVLLVVFAVLGGIIFLVVSAAKSVAHSSAERAEVSAGFDSTPTETPVPTPTPEPTPAPPEVDLNSWELRLVRADNPLPADFVPDLTEIERNEMFDSRAVMHLKQLIADARDAGYTVYVCSGYRAYDTQSWIYWNHVDKYMADGMTQEEAEAATRIAVNYPGGSEHQLGLAADILEYENQDMEPYIGGSGLMLWLEQHCADYGFIVRYPDGKTDITGVEYEPWHLRYVGICARYIMDNNLCLEEFLALYN